jgi:hypothetical protein
MHLTRYLCNSLLLFGFLTGAVHEASAADLGPSAPPAVQPAPSPWSLRLVPYGWLISMNGTQTVRGRSVKVDASFIDIVKESDTLVALMGDFEARNGPLALMADLVWTRIGFDGGAVRSRSLRPGVTGTVGANLGLDVEMAILEAGAAYEVARSGPLAVDILGGLRYWYQEADLSLGLGAGLDVGDLEVIGSRGIARSGSIDWLDPMIGARLRYTVLPGHELFLRGDIGGFGAGSEFSWQAIAGYSFDFAAYQGVTFSGVVGYRALYVDYARGEGRRRYEFDMLQHGPVLGISARF